VVRLPPELVVGDALEHLARGSHLLIELGHQQLCNRHTSLLYQVGLRPTPPPSREALRWAAVALAEAGRLGHSRAPPAPLRSLAARTCAPLSLNRLSRR